MVFCQVCETKAHKGGNYCHNCGTGVESFQNGKSKYKFASLDHHYCQNCNIEIPIHSSDDPKGQMLKMMNL